MDEKLRAISFWRKELVNLNKVRDNHFRYYGDNFDYTLLVSSNKKIGSHLEKNNTKVVRIGRSGGALFFYLRCFVWLVREHYKDPFDIIITPIGEEPIGWLYSRLLIWSRPKLVYDLWDIPGLSVTNISFYNPKRYFIVLYQFVLKKIIKKGDVIIAGVVSEGLDRFNIINRKIIKSQNAIQPEAFSQDVMLSKKDEWRWVKRGYKKILYVGYIHKTRGADLLIDYALHIKNNSVLANILMVGPSDDVTRKRLHKKITKYNVGDVIRMNEEVPSFTVPGIINGADICVCALDDIEKYRWSYPVKIYEYLALGKVVVAANLPGISTIVINGYNGFLYEPGNDNDFFNKIDITVNDMVKNNVQRKLDCPIIDKTYEGIVRDISQSLYDVFKTQ